MATKIQTMTHEEICLQRLEALEHRIDGAWTTISECLVKIEESRIWQYVKSEEDDQQNKYDIFADYLAERHKINSIHTYHKLKTALGKQIKVKPFGLIFKTVGAARAFGGSPFEEWLMSGWLEELPEVLESMAYALAKEAQVPMFSKEKPVVITGKHVKAMSDVISTWVRTGNYVSVEGVDDMIKYDGHLPHHAAMMNLAYEIQQRQVEHIRSKSKFKYEKHVLIVGQPLKLDGYNVGDEIEMTMKVLKAEDES